MSEPVPCAYCGCDTWVPDTVHGDEELYQIRCEDCGVCGPAGTTEDESWDLWNDLMGRIVEVTDSE